MSTVKGHFSDVLSLDVMQHFGLDRKDSEFAKHLQFSERDIDNLTDREILAAGFEAVAQTAAEREIVARYRERMQEADEIQAQLAEQRQVISDAYRARGKRDTDAIAGAHREIGRLNAQLNRIDGQLLKLGATQPLKDYVARAREGARQDAAEKGRQQMARYRTRQQDTRSRAAERAHIVGRVKALDRLLRTPTDQKHIPEQLKNSVLGLLTAFTNDTSVFNRERLERVRQAYANIRRAEQEGGGAVNGYDEDVADLLNTLPDLLDGKRLSQLDMATTKAVRDIVSELCALRWDDVEAEYFIVRQGLVRTKVFDSSTGTRTELTIAPPKSKAGMREIPILPNFAAILRLQRKLYAQLKLRAIEMWKDGNFVFCTETGGPKDPTNIRRALNRVLNASGLKHRGVHALRHTFATNLIRAGIDARTVGERIGHSKVAFTLQTYVHSSTEQKRKALEAVQKTTF